MRDRVYVVSCVCAMAIDVCLRCLDQVKSDKELKKITKQLTKETPLEFFLANKTDFDGFCAKSVRIEVFSKEADPTNVKPIYIVFADSLPSYIIGVIRLGQDHYT